MWSSQDTAHPHTLLKDGAWWALELEVITALLLLPEPRLPRHPFLRSGSRFSPQRRFAEDDDAPDDQVGHTDENRDLVIVVVVVVVVVMVLREV